MREVKRYQSDDGSLFLSANECMTYEFDVKAIEDVIKRLPSLPSDDGCSFSNGEGYLQHDKTIFMEVRKRLLELALEPCNNHKWVKQSIERTTETHSSWPGRIIGECCIKQMVSAWNRISNIDDEFREWGQAYYKAHPEQATIKRLN